MAKEKQTMEPGRRLIPVLREGVEVVRMILFQELREHLARQAPQREPRQLSILAGAVVNRVFGLANPEPFFEDFARENQELIDQATRSLGTELAHLNIPLTDALRIMALCDFQEGQDSSSVLRQAQEWGLLLVERDLPLPHHFIDLTRRLGAAKGLICPLSSSACASTPTAPGSGG
ncbi:MAG: hypothetical protein M0T76_02040 [Desulfobacteraceae bacterium]|nr:hypothetical protein [Desulfobacteraceae bacterium]